MPKMKITTGIATLVFLVFASLQFNDHDQYHNADFWTWIVFYFGTALLSFFVGFGYCKSIPLITGLGGFALGSFVFRMQDQFGNFQFQKFAGRGWFRDDAQEMVQQTNEAGGLLIVAIWVFVLAYLLHKKVKSEGRPKQEV
jgi:hypothetical protein